MFVMSGVCKSSSFVRAGEVVIGSFVVSLLQFGQRGNGSSEGGSAILCRRAVAESGGRVVSGCSNPGTRGWMRNLLPEDLDVGGSVGELLFVLCMFNVKCEEALKFNGTCVVVLEDREKRCRMCG